jgi:membrane protease YdiL (CAAX protease family)
VAGSLLGTLVAVRLLRRRGGPGLAAMGLRREGSWGREIVLGAALGPMAFALVLARALACGWVVVAPGRGDAGGLLLAAIAFTGVAVNEEIATRGFLLQVLGSAWSPAVALVGSSLLFAALHSLNPNVSGVAIAFLVVAGLTLAWGYFATGRLWLPIAFHWSWNFAQGPLFGFPVSGLPVDGLLTVTPTGPDWATGAAFGPEAGLVGLLAEAVVAAIIFGWWRAGDSARATLLAVGGGVLGLLFLALASR